MRRRAWPGWAWLTIRLQLGLAAVLLFAGFAKIADPPGFAQEVANYRLLPFAAVNAVALVLPWLEAMLGLALLCGFWRRAAAGISALLLAVFIGALGINLARGNPVDCGCFGVEKASRTRGERLSDMKLAILRDAGLLVAAGLFLSGLRRQEPGRS